MAKKGTKKPAASGGDDFSYEDFMREHGIGFLTKLEQEQKEYRAYSTGSLMLDIALGERDPITGRPGLQERSIVELFGISQGLKSGTGENLIKQILDADPENMVVCVWAEEPDVDRLIGYGIDLNRVISFDLWKKSDAERFSEFHLDQATMLCRDPRVKLLLVDSIKALCSTKHIMKDGKVYDMDTQEGLAIRASMVTRFVMRFKQFNHSAILFMINQVGDKIQTPGAGYVENPRFNYHTPGGRGMEYECTVRIKVTTSPIFSAKKHGLTQEELLLGWKVTYRLIKNRYSRPTASRTAIVDFKFKPVGFDRGDEVLRCASYLGLVGKGGGGYYEVCGERIRGEQNVKDMLNSDLALRNKLEAEVIARMDELYASPEDVEDELLEEAL